MIWALGRCSQVRPGWLGLPMLAPRGLGGCSALGMGALLGRGVDGCSMETRDGFGLRGWGGAVGARCRPGLTPRGESFDVQWSPPDRLARSTQPRRGPPPLPPRPGTGPFPVLASQLQSVLQKLKFSAGYWVGPQVLQGPGRGLTICSRTCSMPHRKSGASAVKTAHQCLVAGLGFRCPGSSALFDIGNCCRYFKKIGQPV